MQTYTIIVLVVVHVALLNMIYHLKQENRKFFFYAQDAQKEADKWHYKYMNIALETEAKRSEDG